MFDSLAIFKDWWLTNRVMNVPEDAIHFYNKVSGLVLYRQDEFQVELFITQPMTSGLSHIHPNVDSFEVYLSGDISFVCQGETFNKNKLGDSLRIRPDYWHGGDFNENGGAFLSIQKWLNGVKPTSIVTDWLDIEQNVVGTVSSQG
jgi:quercetin dioxygenase-like cupin family protein